MLSNIHSVDKRTESQIREAKLFDLVMAVGQHLAATYTFERFCPSVSGARSRNPDLACQVAGIDGAKQPEQRHRLIGRERVHWPAICTGLKEVSLAECAPMRTKQVPWSTAGTTRTTCRTETVVRNVESNAHEIPQHGECKCMRSARFELHAVLLVAKDSRPHQCCVTPVRRSASS